MSVSVSADITGDEVVNETDMLVLAGAWRVIGDVSR